MNHPFKLGEYVKFESLEGGIWRGVVSIVSERKIGVMSHGYINALWPKELTPITDEGEAMLMKLEN